MNTTLDRLNAATFKLHQFIRDNPYVSYLQIEVGDTIVPFERTPIYDEATRLIGYRWIVDADMVIEVASTENIKERYEEERYVRWDI